MGSERSSFHSATNGMPNDFLTPWLLLLLRNWSMHGYQILQTLRVFGLATLDPTTVYRTLRRLEKDGLISSGWQTGESGPAKRVYTLTEAGQEFLQTWAVALERYQGILDRFFEVYTEQSGQHRRSQNEVSPPPSSPGERGARS
jgi:poly-beta-hydroxybutyrate-responsive repressor